MADPGTIATFYTTFRQIIRLIHASTRVDDIATLVVEQISSPLAACGALLQLYSRQNGIRTVHTVHGLGDIYPERGPVADPQLVLDICTRQELLVVPDLDRDPRFLPPAPPSSPPVKMLVVAPLGLQEDLAGLLSLAFAAPRSLTPEELDFLAAVAQQVACAIDKARLIERQQLQFAQLAQQTERLTTLGRMAAGVAHELNNPLSSILLYSSNMQKKVPPAGPLHEGLGIIIQETKRCKTIIQELQEFSRSKEPKKSLGNLNAILAKVIKLLENEFRRAAIHLTCDLDDNLPDMYFDVGQMQQVFLNLLMNAVEAVAPKGGITVTSRLDPRPQTIAIVIADTGPGIPPEHRDRIFEPFFSTKPKGTGLGLAVTYGFIRNHQGDIQVASEPGAGTRFTITLPVLTPDLDLTRSQS